MRDVHMYVMLLARVKFHCQCNKHDPSDLEMLVWLGSIIVLKFDAQNYLNVRPSSLNVIKSLKPFRQAHREMVVKATT